MLISEAYTPFTLHLQVFANAVDWLFLIINLPTIKYTLQIMKAIGDRKKDRTVTPIVF